MVKIIEHSLLKYKMTLLRDKNTDSNKFREIIEEITVFIAYEALKNIKVKDVKIDTPITKNAKGYVLNEKIVIVPILRAGLGMVNGIRRISPNVKEGHIGIYRQDEELIATTYYNKLPKETKDAKVLILDPMLATGVTINDAINEVKKTGNTNISVLSILGTQQGIDNVIEKNPDVDIYVAAIDPKLTKDGYIYPGLGDAGDRLFGTK